jgi:hypothetical protein
MAWAWVFFWEKFRQSASAIQDFEKIRYEIKKIRKL